MRKLAVLTGLGAAALLFRKLRRRGPDQGQPVPDFTAVDTDHPEEKIEEIEEATDVPGGVRP